jgi:mRNA interferase MazF
MTTGDIHWIDLPDADGREQAGRRPAVVLLTQPYCEQLPVVLVVPLTSALAALRFPGTLLLEPNERNGLRQQSVVLVFQLRAVDRTRVGERVGATGPGVTAAILETLDRLTGRELE